MTTLEYLRGIAIAAEPTGSRVICDPPVLDTDEDYVVWALTTTGERLEVDGFIRTTPDSYDGLDGDFVMFRRGEVNLITTRDFDRYVDFTNATRLAKHLKLNLKEDRIALFQAIVEDNWPSTDDLGL